MLGINRKNGRLALAVLAGLGLAGVASQARATVVYSTDYTSSPVTFTTGDSWTANGQTTDGLNSFITGGSSAIIATNPSAYTGNAYNSPSPGASTASLPAWQGAPNLNTNALELIRPSGSAIGVGPNLSSLTTVNSASQNSAITVSTYVGTKPASGTGTGPFVGLDLFGNNDAVEIGAFGIDTATGNVIYSPDGVHFFTTGISEAPLATNGEYDQLQLTAAFTGGNGTDAGQIQLTGYIDGAQAFSVTSDAGGVVNSLSHAYEWAGTLGATDTNATYDAYFGDYEVTQALTANVPEPTALGLIGVCGVMLAARRSRRSVAL